MTKKYNRSNNRPATSSPVSLMIPLIILTVIGWFLFSTYQGYTNFPSNSPKNKFILNIDKGDNFGSIGTKLADQNVLNQSWALTAKTNLGSEKFTLQPGKYTLKVPANPDDIHSQIKERSEELTGMIKTNTFKPTAQVTIKEGMTADDVIFKLVSANVATESELKKILTDNTAFSTKDYEFLPKPLDCKYGSSDCAKYYLEGFLYPDTYEFFTPTEPKEAIKKLLDNFQNKAWSKISSNAKGKDLTKVITMASVIEKETGRPIGGINSSNIDEVNTEKKIMAGVFYNRLENNQKWQSDPTVTYGTGKSLCQRTLKSQTDCLFLNSPEAENKYSTYNNIGYPIGPIATPTVGSIEAVLSPKDNDYIFFVSDASGKKYFATTNEQHESNIAKADVINQQYRK